MIIRISIMEYFSREVFYGRLFGIQVCISLIFIIISSILKYAYHIVCSILQL